MINHPERLDKDIDILRIAKKKPKQATEVKRKHYWEEEVVRGLSVPVVPTLPQSASRGDLVYLNGLYIYLDGWKLVTGGRRETTTRGGAVLPTGFIILPEPEAVYATKSGGGDIYVAVTNGGRMRRLVFDATALPSVDASATFAMTAGFDYDGSFDLLFTVVSNQISKTLEFTVTTAVGYDFNVATDTTGTGFKRIEIKGSPTITVTRRYTDESGLSYPCWAACGLVLFQKK